MDVNKKQLADIFSVTDRTLTDWEAKGMPVKYKSGRGIANVYDTAAVIDWRIKLHISGESRVTARERNDLAQAMLRELELADKSGTYLKEEDIAFVMEGQVVAARTAFMNGARDLKKKIKQVYGIDVDLRIIQERDDIALAKLAEYSPERDEVDGSDLEEMAATGTD